MGNEKKKEFDKVLEYVSPEVSSILRRLPDNYRDRIEEIRLRNGKPLMVCYEDKDYLITEKGTISKDDKERFYVTKEHIYKTFQLISSYSIYAFEEEMKSGFITLKGGHRIGIAGKVIYGQDGIETIKNISSLNIRIAKEKIGVSNKVMKHIIKYPNSIYHTLIVSPPKCGKTTLLRDIIRNISNGMPELGFKGLKVGVVDERSELAGMYNSCPQNNMGIRTDVLDGCYKKDGIQILIRAMSPDVIATDELGAATDISVINEALKVGVKLISTVHGDSWDDLLTRNNLRQLIEERIFERIIFLDNSMGIGTIKDIVDGHTFKTVLGKGGYKCL